MSTLCYSPFDHSGNTVNIVTEIFSASQRKFRSHDSAEMLDAIRHAQSRFIVEKSSRESFGDLLDILLYITDSEYGFIGEVFQEDDGKPYLKTHAITNIAWSEETLALYEKYTAEEGMEFRNLNTLFGEVLKNGEAVIANQPKDDPRSGGLPPGHPAMRSFMGLPFYFNGKMVGMIGVANNPSGYAMELVDWLTPLLSTCATLIVGYRNSKERALAEQSLQEANNYFRAVLQTVPDLMFEIDESGRYVNVWGLGGDLLYAPKSELIGNNVSDILPPEAAQQVLDAIGDAKTGGTCFGRQISLPLVHGLHWFELSVSRKGNIPDAPDTYIVLSRDITAKKQAEEELRIAAATFESQEAIVISDAEKKILRVNRSYEEITGYESEEVIGRELDLQDSRGQDVNDHEVIWAQLNQTGKWVGEVWDRRKNGEVFPKHMTITAVYGRGENLINYVLVFTDISQRKQSEEEIHKLAFYDPLTHLPNRRLLVERLRQAMEKSLRSNRYGALLFLDLDHFKLINDTKGHAVGDQMLIEVARRLEKFSRKVDTVARLSGDEFVVVLEELSQEPGKAATQAELIAEKINAELSREYMLGEYKCFTTPSIGIALFLGHQDNLDVVFRNADVAMYQAKGAGRNTIRFFDPQMQIALEARSALEADLRLALERKEFSLYYQIQVDSQDRPLGAEALLRWEHPRRGLVLPDQFIPLAEETGLIGPIGLWVLEAACMQIIEWQREPETRNLTLSVNLSAKQLHQQHFASHANHIVSSTGVDPFLLKLELTESSVLENFVETVEVMAELKSLGVRFSLDDFGTGHSSLKYLKKLPLDQIKIDRSFVRDIVTDSNDATIVNTIIAMSKAMDLDVIAEGVETEAQRQFLIHHGCQHFQGYLFGKPSPIDSFIEKLKLSRGR